MTEEVNFQQQVIGAELYRIFFSFMFKLSIDIWIISFSLGTFSMKVITRFRRLLLSDRPHDLAVGAPRSIIFTLMIFVVLKKELTFVFVGNH